MFYITATNHPMRRERPEDAKLFLVPTLSTYIAWSIMYGSTDTLVCNNGVCSRDLLVQADNVLEDSKGFQRSQVSNHIVLMTSLHWDIKWLFRDYRIHRSYATHPACQPFLLYITKHEYWRLGTIEPQRWCWTRLSDSHERQRDSIWSLYGSGQHHRSGAQCRLIMLGESFDNEYEYRCRPTVLFSSQKKNMSSEQQESIRTQDPLY